MSPEGQLIKFLMDLGQTGIVVAVGWILLSFSAKFYKETLDKLIESNAKNIETITRSDKENTASIVAGMKEIALELKSHAQASVQAHQETRRVVERVQEQRH